MKPTVAVYGILRFPPENIAKLLPDLKKFVAATRANDGCITYDVAEDLFEPGVIRFSELWPDRKNLNQHLIAPHIEPWRKVAKDLGLMERKFYSFDIHSDSISI